MKTPETAHKGRKRRLRRCAALALCAPTIALLALAPTASAHAGGLLATHRLTVAHGGTVRAANGWALYVPPHVLAHDGVGTIRRLGGGHVAITIDARWYGMVRVTAPLHRRDDRIAHDLGGLWLPESRRAGRHSAWVASLSPFSLKSIVDKGQAALCLSVVFGDLPGFVECVGKLGLQYVSGKVISWLVSQISPSCYASLLASGISSKASKIPVSVLKGALLNDACRQSAGGPPSGGGSDPLPNPIDPQQPGVDPQQPGGSVAPPTVNPQEGVVYTVMNTSETPPDGVWMRNSPHTADTDRVTGHGVYMNERVELLCYGWGDAVGPYANRLWYDVVNLSRPTNAGVRNAGWLNAHYIDDGALANVVDPGVPPCG
jgi:hypothetical protein